MTAYHHYAVDSIVNPVELSTTEVNGLVIIRKFLDEGSCRRSDDLVASAGIDDVEDSVVIEVLSVGVCIALGEAETICDFI